MNTYLTWKLALTRGVIPCVLVLVTTLFPVTDARAQSVSQSCQALAYFVAVTAPPLATHIAGAGTAGVIIAGGVGGAAANFGSNAIEESCNDLEHAIEEPWGSGPLPRWFLRWLCSMHPYECMQLDIHVNFHMYLPASPWGCISVTHCADVILDANYGISSISVNQLAAILNWVSYQHSYWDWNQLSNSINAPILIP